LEELKKYDFKTLIKEGESFRVKCSDRKVCVLLGQFIKDNTNAGVNLEHPSKIVFVDLVGDEFLVYSLLADELINRGYSVSNVEFITPDVAGAMVDYSGWSDNGTLLDPFCHEGYVIIEACLKGLGVGPGFFKAKEFSFDVEKPIVEKLKSKIVCFSTDLSSLKFAKQNAKLARVSKYVRFGFHDLNDLDYKMKERTINFLITALPKHVNVEKLFFQLDYIMSSKGVVVLYTNQDLSVMSEYRFKKVDEVVINKKRLVKLVRG
jgi:23S rRNA G2445 N2-methylase RlmL